MGSLNVLRENVDRLRRQRKLTISSLAKSVDLSVQALSGFLKGRHNIGSDKLDGLAEALNVCVVELFTPQSDLPRQTVEGEDRYASRLSESFAVLEAYKRALDVALVEIARLSPADPEARPAGEKPSRAVRRAPARRKHSA